MAYRLKFSARALRETGDAQEWYELQSPGLGAEFMGAMELQLKRLEQAPLHLFRGYPKCAPRSPSPLSLRFILCSAE